MLRPTVKDLASSEYRGNIRAYVRVSDIFHDFFAAASAAASIYTDAKIRNGEYVRTYVRMYVCTLPKNIVSRGYIES